MDEMPSSHRLSLMVGLVFVDTLTLTLRQHTSIILNMLVCCYGWDRFRTHSGASSWKRDTKYAFVSAFILFYGFYGVAITRDVHLLFASSAFLSKFPWGQYLTEFAHYDYVKLQPPFLSFAFSRCPSYLFHQSLCVTLMCLGLPVLVSLYGRQAYLIAATPLYGLVLIQPGTDVWLFWWLVVTVVMMQRKRLWLSAIMYGIAFVIKPLSLLVLPVFVWRLRHRILASLVVIAGYWWWSHATYFGTKQWGFLSHQLMIRPLSRGMSLTREGPRTSLYFKMMNAFKPLWGTFMWRWDHLGKSAVCASWWYVFPAYLSFFKLWPPALTAVLILLGFGNIKYLLFVVLALPFRDKPSSFSL